MGNEIDRSDSLYTALTEEERVVQYAHKGMCRLWTKEALTFIKTHYPDFFTSIEAREIVTAHFIEHTFLLAEKDEDRYVLDGTGVETFPPYFGLEKDAPEFYKKSHTDILNFY